MADDLRFAMEWGNNPYETIPKIHMQAGIILEKRLLMNLGVVDGLRQPRFHQIFL
jgi:hypothetical protein